MHAVKLLRHVAYNCPITSNWRVQLLCSNKGCLWPIRFENFDIVMIRITNHLLISGRCTEDYHCVGCVDTRLLCHERSWKLLVIHIGFSFITLDLDYKLVIINKLLLPMCGLLIPKWADTRSSLRFLEIAPNLWDWCIEQTNKIMFETQALVPGEPIKLNCMVPLLDWCCINVSNCPGNGGLWQYYGITNYLEKASRGKETQRLKNLNSCR